MTKTVDPEILAGAHESQAEQYEMLAGLAAEKLEHYGDSRYPGRTAEIRGLAFYQAQAQEHRAAAARIRQGA